MNEKQDYGAVKPKRYKLLFRYIWAASYFMGIGIYVATTVVVCIWLGKKADEFFGSAPTGTITGIFLGFPMAIYSIYSQVKMHFGKKEDGE